MKLVFIENEAGGSLNHLGVEVETSSEVEAKTRRLVSEKSTTEDELGVECCYARRNKVWARDPTERNGSGPPCSATRRSWSTAPTAAEPGDKRHLLSESGKM